MKGIPAQEDKLHMQIPHEQHDHCLKELQACEEFRHLNTR